MTELAFEAFFAIFEVIFFSTLLLVESFSISLSLKNELLNTVVVEIHFLVWKGIYSCHEHTLVFMEQEKLYFAANIINPIRKTFVCIKWFKYYG